MVRRAARNTYVTDTVTDENPSEYVTLASVSSELPLVLCSSFNLQVVDLHLYSSTKWTRNNIHYEY